MQVDSVSLSGHVWIKSVLLMKCETDRTKGRRQQGPEGAKVVTEGKATRCKKQSSKLEVSHSLKPACLVFVAGARVAQLS